MDIQQFILPHCKVTINTLFESEFVFFFFVCLIFCLNVVGNNEMIEVLANHNANLSSKNWLGVTPLHLATRNGQINDIFPIACLNVCCVFSFQFLICVSISISDV